jgi:KaiC/GvpD/RAD55 family RecA-like ATPase
VKGLDCLIGGGFAVGRSTLVLGPRGSGKTLLALQALYSGTCQGEPGIFVTFREKRQQIALKGALFRWKLGALEKRGLLFFRGPPDIRAGRVDLAGLLSELGDLVAKERVRRIVFDALEIPLNMIDDRLSQTQEVFRLRDWFFETGITGIVTADPMLECPGAAERSSLLQFLADLTLALEHDPVAAPGTAERFARLVRYRSSHAETKFPVLIGGGGIEILVTSGRQPGLERAPARLAHEIEAARKALTARVKSLDRFLEIKQAELDYLLDESDNPMAAAQAALETGNTHPE